MTNPHGTPIWYELLTPDHAASKRFYDAVIGWTIGDKPPGDLDYRMISAGDGQVGGVMALTEAMTTGGAKPSWLFYLGVDDVDATADRITAAGGAVLMPPVDLPGVGRMAFVADPMGAPFYIMRGSSDAQSTAFRYQDTAAPGHAIWNELSAPDPAAAIAFYAQLFGWRQEGAMRMGELGEYQFIHDANGAIGAVMPVMPDARPGWLFYFMVTEIDAAASRVAQAGGAIEQEPVEIPGGSFSLVATDPHGVRFGLVGDRS